MTKEVKTLSDKDIAKLEWVKNILEGVSTHPSTGGISSKLLNKCQRVVSSILEKYEN